MHNPDLSDTIAAIATAVGESGIGIVRLSGKDALAIADKIFAAKDNRNPSEFKTYTAHYGWIISRLVNLSPRTPALPHPRTEIIDEVILTVMRAVRSYTKEDIVEISCHGGIVALRRILDLVLESGARLASPGEFTKRAFLNGRIDLAQAEAVLDVIRAKTDSALKISLQQLKGELSRQINKIKRVLSDALMVLEANIDFPEDGIEEVNLKQIFCKLDKANALLEDILVSSRAGRILREGIQAVICGKPNAGKSSLLNALLRQERSIVTPVAGTTRDTIEEIIDIKGIPVRIVDTAGILEPRDLIEKKAVERSRKYIDAADLAILVFDGAQKLSREDDFLIRKLKKKTVLAIINKMDLEEKIEKDKIFKYFPQAIAISAKKSRNIDLLEAKIADLVYQGKISSGEPVIVSNSRHISAMREAQKLIAGALNSLDNKLSLEFIAQDIKESLGYLDEILGKRFSENLLDKIFSEFCIGK
jgi:tRNA modification GTPase